jgi:hypothetical protein
MLSQPQGHIAGWRIRSMNNSNETIGNRFLDLPVCSAVLQPLHHRAPRYEYVGSVKVGVLCGRSSDHHLLDKNCDLQINLLCMGDGGKRYAEIKKMNEKKKHTFVWIIEKISTEGLSEDEVSVYLRLIKKENKTERLVCPHCLRYTRGEPWARML